MDFLQQLIICIIGGIIGGAGIGYAILKTLVQAEARKELSPEIKKWIKDKTHKKNSFGGLGN